VDFARAASAESAEKQGFRTGSDLSLLPILGVAETQSGGEVELRSSAEQSDGGTSGGKSMRLSNTSSVTHSRDTFSRWRRLFVTFAP
jgi:hypothetical protein